MTYSMPIKHALSDALSVMLPTPEVTLLLRGCLDKGIPGKRACEAWLENQTEPQKKLIGEVTKAFLPLLFHAVQTHGIDVPGRFRTVLRTAAWREELRTRTYRRICRDVFAVLAGKQIPTIVLKGAALAETAYSNPALRHSHDIEILVQHYELHDIAGPLISLGFSPSRKTSRRGSEDLELIHQSGLPLVLHRELFQIPFYNAAHSDVCSRARMAVISEIPVRVLSPADALFHTCGHAVYSPSRESFRWIADAWFIIHKHPDLNWDLLVDCARRSHLALPLSVMFGYLSKDLNVSVPWRFLNCLSLAARKSRSIERELALFGARSSKQGGFKNLIRKARNWPARGVILKWMLLPSPTYVLWISQTRHVWLLPVQYFCRPIKYVSRRISPTLNKIFRRICIRNLAQFITRAANTVALLF